MIWNSENSTYYDKGKRAYGLGDELSAKVIDEMGKETLDEYVEKGWIANSITRAEVEAAERNDLFKEAESLGLKPHYKAGIAKLSDMIEEHLVMAALKKEALSFGIDSGDDMTFAELKPLVDEKRAESSEVVNKALKPLLGG